ncbi:MAG: heme exporter protein CcmD [Ferrovum sp.]|nr:heme exporter protein CcmD [Ferrovum sp.]NDU86616.1 heme exporter protein CcmD [Ferrovum sp.]
MHWTSWQEFLTMRGYGLYVWGSFGACAAGMILEPLLLNQRWRSLQSRLPHEKDDV